MNTIDRFAIRNRNVLITGGLGFIGLVLARELVSRGHEVTLFDNLNPQIHGALPHIDEVSLPSTRVRVIRADVRDRTAVASALEGADAIVHLAAETGTAQSMYQIAHYNEVNSQATAVILDVLASSTHSVSKLVLASSRAIYGEGAYVCQDHGNVYPESRALKDLHKHQWEPVCPYCQKIVRAIPTPEIAVPRPASIYAATKVAQEDMVRIAGAALNISTVVLRLQNVYGPGQSLNNPYTGILSIFSTRIRRGMSLPIFEDGQESRDFVHVNDVARAMRLALESPKADGGTFNIGTGVPITVIDIARLLVQLLGGKTTPEVTGRFRLGDIRHCYADLTQATGRLGYVPEITINDGLRQFVDWVRSQPLPEDGLDRANDELIRRKMMS